MNDLEISKALALKIGYRAQDITPTALYSSGVWVWHGQVLKMFDYRDWAVIGPIAERYNAFPFLLREGGWTTPSVFFTSEDTPQKAIAMAVIGEKK